MIRCESFFLNRPFAIVCDGVGQARFGAWSNIPDKRHVYTGGINKAHVEPGEAAAMLAARNYRMHAP